MQPAHPGERQIGEEWGRVRRVHHQRRESRQNILLEESCRLNPLPSAEIFPAQESGRHAAQVEVGAQQNTPVAA